MNPTTLLPAALSLPTSFVGSPNVPSPATGTLVKTSYPSRERARERVKNRIANVLFYSLSPTLSRAQHHTSIRIPRAGEGAFGLPTKEVGHDKPPGLRCQWILPLFISLFSSNALFSESVVNLYAWGGEIPKSVIQQFENETGIHVNFSTYDSNETMYAKLRSSQKSIYDVVLPSAYFVERMQKQGLLTKLDHSKLPNIQNLAPRFIHNDYDNGNQYSMPLIWGATGIFYNQNWVEQPPKTWSALWEPRWRGQLMLLDDSREVFAQALMSLHYSPNDTNPDHIQAAFKKLLALIPNIKLFSSEGIQAVIIDEDAIAGSAWNGDAFKAHAENKHVEFVYPDDGFVIWIDCLAMPINPPHPEEAYQLINYLLKAETAAKIALKEGHAITNLAGIKLLPDEIRNNVMVYPTDDVMKRSYVQRDVGEETIALYNRYWQDLKLAF